MAGYKGMAEYSKDLKIRACKMYFEEGKRTIEICQELGIKNRAQPQAWYKEYLAGGGYDVIGIGVKGRKKRSRVDETEFRIQQLTMENELLRDFLQMLERV